MNIFKIFHFLILDESVSNRILFINIYIYIYHPFTSIAFDTLHIGSASNQIDF